MWAPTSRHTNAYSHAYTTCTHLLGNSFKSISTTHFECTYSKTVVNIPNQRNQLKNCFRRMVEIPSIHAHFSCQPLKSFLIEAIPSCIVLSHKKGLDRVEFMDRSPIARCCKRQLPKFRVLCSRPEKFGIFETIDLFGGSKFRHTAQVSITNQEGPILDVFCMVRIVFVVLRLFQRLPAVNVVNSTNSFHRHVKNA